MLSGVEMTVLVGRAPIREGKTAAEVKDAQGTVRRDVY
jgi:hypothetical protein